MSRRTLVKLLRQLDFPEIDQGSIAIKRAAAFLACFLLPVAAARAQTVCVVCSEPAATYRCAVEKSDKLARLGTIADKALQHVCIKEMARLKGHASCAVSRDATPATCQGLVQEIPLASLVAAPSEQAAVSPPAPEPAVPPPAKTSDGPPRTVQELAERTSETSKKQLKSVGDGIGDAASKTWECLTTLFKRC